MSKVLSNSLPVVMIRKSPPGPAVYFSKGAYRKSRLFRLVFREFYVLFFVPAQVDAIATVDSSVMREANHIPLQIIPIMPWIHHALTFSGFTKCYDK
jgi:hypothetical protein